MMNITENSLSRLSLVLKLKYLMLYEKSEFPLIVFVEFFIIIYVKPDNSNTMTTKVLFSQKHCPVLNFFSTVDAVLNGLSNLYLEDGFNARIFLSTFWNSALFV